MGIRNRVPHSGWHVHLTARRDRWISADVSHPTLMVVLCPANRRSVNRLTSNICSCCNVNRSEHVFEEGDAMSVALEVEYEAFYPRLQVVPDVAGANGALGARAEEAGDPRRGRRGAARAAGAADVADQGTGRQDDRRARLRRRARSTWFAVATPSPRSPSGWVGTTWPALERHLADEAGSTVLVPGEHLLIP